MMDAWQWPIVIYEQPILMMLHESGLIDSNDFGFLTVQHDISPLDFYLISYPRPASYIIYNFVF